MDPVETHEIHKLHLYLHAPSCNSLICTTKLQSVKMTHLCSFVTAVQNWKKIDMQYNVHVLKSKVGFLTISYVKFKYLFHPCFHSKIHVVFRPISRWQRILLYHIRIPPTTTTIVWRFAAQKKTLFLSLNIPPFLWHFGLSTVISPGKEEEEEDGTTTVGGP